jgi:CRP-like cAMP-binding protein
MGLLTPADLQVVARIAVFAGLRPETIQRLIGPATVASLPQGATVFRQGEPATAFFIVVDGWVKLYRIALSGEETVLHVLGKGDSFAEAVAFTNGRYPATAEAVSDARVVRILSSHVVRCIREVPDIALAMIASTSQHLHRLVQQVEQLKVQNGAQRVAEFLCTLCPAADGACTIVLPYDKVLIAGRLGLKPESLSRAFARLKAIGVDVLSSQVTVKDVAQLRRLAADDRSSMRAVLENARAGNPCGLLGERSHPASLDAEPASGEAPMVHQGTHGPL